MDKQVILGVGMGRCGLYSFSKLVALQNFTNMTWNFGNLPIINWEYNHEDFEKICYWLEHRDSNVVGDASHFLLNYIEPITKKYPNVKVVWLKRAFEETVISFKNFIYKMTETEFPNLWTYTERTHLQLAQSSNPLYFYNLYNTFPTFEEFADVNECLNFYADYYRMQMENLLLDHGGMIYEAEVEWLSDPLQSKHMLRWLGFEDPLFCEYHLDNPNVSGAKK